MSELYKQVSRGSSTGAYQWCSHLANASKAAPAIAISSFGHFQWLYSHNHQTNKQTNKQTWFITTLTERNDRTMTKQLATAMQDRTE